MLQLNNRYLQEALMCIPNATINHTKTHTVVWRDSYLCHVEQVQTDKKTGQPEQAYSHRVLWDENKNRPPLNMEHLKLRAEVSMALKLADYRVKKNAA